MEQEQINTNADKVGTDQLEEYIDKSFDMFMDILTSEEKGKEAKIAIETIINLIPKEQRSKAKKEYLIRVLQAI